MTETDLSALQAKQIAINRLMSRPDPEAKTATRMFTIDGDEWTFTIQTGAKHHAEEFYRLLGKMGQAREECAAAKGVTFYAPDGARITVTEPGYLASLYVLAEVIVEPAFSADELAWFGHKYGIYADALFDWAMQENGVTDYLMNQYLEAAKNASGRQESKASSCAPASNSATRSRRKR